MLLLQMFESDLQQIVDMTLNSNETPETKIKKIYSLLDEFKRLKTEVTFNMHLMILSSLTDEFPDDEI